MPFARARSSNSVVGAKRMSIWRTARIVTSQEVPMRNSWSVLVLLALAAVAGYATSARPVQAQAEAFPFHVGDIVTFLYEENGSRQCRIEQIHGAFARCGSPVERQGPTIG